MKVRIAGTNCYLPSVFNLYLHGFLLFLRARICRPLNCSPSAEMFSHTLVVRAAVCVPACVCSYVLYYLVLGTMLCTMLFCTLL